MADSANNPDQKYIYFINRYIYTLYGRNTLYSRKRFLYIVGNASVRVTYFSTNYHYYYVL